MQIEHPFKPIYNKNSKILILGSFPSVKSRKDNFYYAHPQNRFWRVLAKIFNENIPVSIEEKKKILLENNIAIWDVIKSCKIVGSSDASIKEPIINDINELIKTTNISCIYFNGNKAYDIYMRYFVNKPNIPHEVLPSTSPANAVWSFEKLYDYWYDKIVGGKNI